MKFSNARARAFPNIKAVFALVTAGVEMDVLGVAFNERSNIHISALTLKWLPSEITSYQE